MTRFEICLVVVGVWAVSSCVPSALSAEERRTLKVISVDSEEVSGSESGHATNAVDGNPATFWHTQWRDKSPACPHEIVIQLEPPVPIKGVSYLPRQDGVAHSRIKDYQVYLSDDGTTFGDAVATGVFDNNGEKQYALFAPRRCAFFKLVAKSEVSGQPWTAAAEIGVVQDTGRAVAAAADCPLKHGRWESLAALTDEFDGERLDELKWYPNCPGWLGREPAYFNPKNVRVAEGFLHLDAKKETIPKLPPAYHTYTTAFVKARAKVRYGYFEIRAQAMDSQASSAFWFYDTTPEIWSEIDVFEIGARPQPSLYYMNTHVFHTLAENVHWDKSRIWRAPYNLSKEFHVYGLEWDPEVLRFYIDGAVVREEQNTHWHQPLALCFDSETFAEWFGLPKDDALPATYSIDYVRAWKRQDGPPDTRPLAVEFAFPDRKDGVETAHPFTLEEAGKVVVKARGGAIRPERVHLDYVNEAFFAAQTVPEVSKQLTLKDRAGKGLSLRISWSKTAPWKRDGRSTADKASAAPEHGYHAVNVDVRPPMVKPRGSVELFEFRDANDAPMQITVRH